MELDFDIQGVSIVGISLPLPKELYQEYQFHLPSTLSRAADSRKEDYLAGRICAFRAAKSLGIELNELPTSVDRSPFWPRTLCGSITHSKKMAVSCVSLSDHYISLGIDAEEIISDKLDIKDQVANEAELLLIAENFQLGLTVLFSAKEALYKALYPIVKTYIDFKEVELTHLDFKNKIFEIKVLTNDLPSMGQRVFKGKYQEIENTIVSLIILTKQSEEYVHP